MVKQVQKKFDTGDKVFAKVRGYPAWPAKIQGVVDQDTKHAKYNVYFYGTKETGLCKLEDLFEYVENKEKFAGGKLVKRKFFYEGIDELEEDMKNDSPAPGFTDKEKKAPAPTTASDEVTSKKVVSKPEVMNVDSDAEIGDLVIDEGGEKKKSMKRKSMTASTTPDVNESKKKRGRQNYSTPKQDPNLDSQGEEVQEKELVSRSGRIIKPKRFADSDRRDTDKNDHHSGRGRAKKIEDAVENQASTTPVTSKKRSLAEKKNNVDELTSDETIVLPTIESPEKSGRYILAHTFSGENVGIKLDFNRPLSFPSEKAQEQWESANNRRAMKLKAQLESGEIIPEQVKERLDFSVHIPGEAKRTSFKDGINQQQNFKLKWLRIEAQLLELDAQIKSNLGLDKANADECLQAMDVMFNLTTDPLMLKKHPQIVETIKRLRRYIGNLSDWKLTEEETVIFKQKAEFIRQKAELIYNKFKKMFTIPEGQNFWQSFSEQVDHFKELTKDMPEDKVFALIADPASLLKSPDISMVSDSLEDGSILVEPETCKEDEDDDIVEKDSTAVNSESK